MKESPVYKNSTYSMHLVCIHLYGLIEVIFGEDCDEAIAFHEPFLCDLGDLILLKYYR